MALRVADAGLKPQGIPQTKEEEVDQALRCRLSLGNHETPIQTPKMTSHTRSITSLTPFPYHAATPATHRSSLSANPDHQP